jgi:hypothetical protein
MTKTIGSYLRRHHIALLALFVALGGTSYAAVSLAPNSVATKQIKNGQVKTADLGKNSITSPKVRDGSLTASDFASGQLPAGPRGPAGQQGEPGKPGADGAPATKLFVASDESGNVLASSGLTTHGQVFVKKGEYFAQFNHDVSQCARMASINGDQPAFIRTTLVGTNGVRVNITNASNPGIDESGPFSLAILC